MIAQAASLATTQLVNQEMLGLRLVITIPLAILGLVGKYHEFMGHSDVLVGVDGDQAAKWEKLAKWYAWTSAASIGGTFLMLLGGIFALIVLVGTIGIVVVAILGIVYLWQTRKALSLYVEANVPKA